MICLWGALSLGKGEGHIPALYLSPNPSWNIEQQGQGYLNEEMASNLIQVLPNDCEELQEDLHKLGKGVKMW